MKGSHVIQSMGPFHVQPIAQAICVHNFHQLVLETFTQMDQ